MPGAGLPVRITCPPLPSPPLLDTQQILEDLLPCYFAPPARLISRLLCTCVWPGLRTEGREGMRVCACVRPGGSISGWTGWVGPPLSPGPEVGWGWGVTRRDSLSPLRIREGGDRRRAKGDRACPPCGSAPGRVPQPPGLSGRCDSKEEQEEPEEGSLKPLPAPNLPAKLVRREGPGPGPGREEGRPQLHPAPLASFPAPSPPPPLPPV